VIVALAGRAGTGKTTISHYLGQKYGFVRLAFADPLKRLAQRYFGFSPGEIGERKTPAGRRTLQGIGMMFREQVAPDYWVRQMTPRLDALVAEGHKIIIDDCRFPNEKQLTESRGGAVWRVVRAGQQIEYGPDHITETALDPLPDAGFAAVITNNGSFEDLHRQVEAAYVRTTVAGR
jgi:hypothetical protein